MEQANINQLIEQFHQESDQLSTVLAAVNSRLREGKAPTDKQVGDLTTHLAGVRQRYDEVLHAAQSLSQDTLKSGKSVDEYLKAAALGIQQQKLEELQQLRSVLDEFLSIRSNKERYEALLEPLRLEVFELIDAIEKPARLEEVDGLLEKVQGPRYFVEAVKEAPGSPRLGLLIEEELNDRYPAEVLLGFLTNAYEFGDEPLTRPEPAAGGGKKTKARRAPKAEAKAAPKTEKAPVEKKKTPEPPPAPKAPEIPEIQWGTAAADPLVVVEAVNRIRTGPPNGSSFRSKLAKLDNDLYAIPILQILDYFGAVTPELAFVLADVERMVYDPDLDAAELVHEVLDSLADRGWAAKYEIEDKPPIYGITSFAAGSMRKETVQKMFRSEWPLPFEDDGRTFGAKESAARLLHEVAHKEALADYLDGRISEIGFDIYRQVVDSVRWVGDHYQILLYSRGPEGPQRYNLITPDALSNIPANEPVIIVGDPRRYSREQIENWQAPVLYLDLDTGVSFLRDAIDAFDAEDNTETAAAESASESETEQPGADGIVDSKLLSDLGPLTDSSLLPVLERSLSRPAITPQDVQEAVVESVVLARAGALAPDVNKGKLQSAQLQLAANVVLDDLDYTGAQLSDLFMQEGSYPEAYLFGAYAFALLAPAMPSDYVLRSQARGILTQYETQLATLPQFKGLLRALVDVAETTANGFSPAAMDALGGPAEHDQYLRTLMEDAANYAQPLTPNVNLKALAPIYKKIFGLGSMFQKCLKIIAGDDRSRRDEVVAELEQFSTANSQGAMVIDPARIDTVLDEYWNTFCRNKNNRKLSYHARDQLIRLMRVRLDLMHRWVEYVDAAAQGPKEKSELLRLRTALLREISAVQEDATWKGHEHANLLSWILNRMRERVQGPVDDRRLFNVFLLTGHVMLREDGRPIIDDRFSSISRYAPWTLVARHIEDRTGTGPASRATFRSVREEIDGTVDAEDGEDGLLDNLQQLEMIGKLTDEPEAECKVTQEQIDEALEYADTVYETFEEHLELYHMLGQITEEEKEALKDLTASNRDFFYQSRNLASWREFLDAVSWEGVRNAQKRTDLLLSEIDERREKLEGEAPQLETAQALLEQTVPNITLAEEALNNFDMGLEPETGTKQMRFERDAFGEFRKDTVYRTLYEECRRQGTGTSARPLKRFGVSFFDKHHMDTWTADDIASSTQFLQNWPASKGAPTTKHIATVMQRLGFRATGAERVQMLTNAELYRVRTEPVPADGGPYQHPIPAFGTRLPEELEVAVIYGQSAGEDLFNTLAQLKTTGMPIVLLDSHLDQGQRRVIAELFRTHSDQQAFLLIDRVLALYLSLAPPAERVSAMLQCTLPYAGLQPFAEDDIPDELFSGRQEETAELLSPTGAAILFGGRQTGKTALLKHVQRSGTRADEGRYYVYVDAAKLDTEKKLARAVAKALAGEAPGAWKAAASLADLADAIETAVSGDDISALGILIDNMDSFLASAEDGQELLRPLAELHRDSEGKFKVVLAGTTETVRALRREPEDGVLHMLGEGLRLGQMRQTAAEDMLVAPLEYLGFRTGHQGEIETMLANTNYYPGVIRDLGRTLVKTLAEHSNKYYSASTGNPPYPLRSTELSAVMHSPELHDKIRRTVQLSLDLDSRYEGIARCIAWLCISDGSGVRRMYSTEEIGQVAHAYETPALAQETPESLSVLLDEMVDMGLVLQNREGRYRLRRDSLLDVVGRDQAVLEEQLAASEEVPA